MNRGVGCKDRGGFGDPYLVGNCIDILEKMDQYFLAMKLTNSEACRQSFIRMSELRRQQWVTGMKWSNICYRTRLCENVCQTRFWTCFHFLWNVWDIMMRIFLCFELCWCLFMTMRNLPCYVTWVVDSWLISLFVILGGRLWVVESFICHSRIWPLMFLISD